MIGYIIGSLCIIILLIAICYFIIKKEKYKEWNIYQNEINQKKGELLREYNTLEQNINGKIKQNEEMLARENQMTGTIIAQKQAEIAAAMEKFGSEQSAILEEDFEKRQADFNAKTQLWYFEIERIQQILNDFHAKRAAVNEALLKEKEIREQKDFYRVIISDADLSDIALLSTIEPQLRNKEALNKLIFEVFYKTPLKAMINRVSNGRDISGIYKITNLQTQECYVGKSVHITPDRWTEHVKTALNIGKIARTRIHDAMRQYGIHNFTFEILEEVEKDKLTEREKFYIELYQSNISGYNMKIG